jgi:hypothetical protein
MLLVIATTTICTIYTVSSFANKPPHLSPLLIRLVLDDPACDGAASASTQLLCQAPGVPANTTEEPTAIHGSYGYAGRWLGARRGTAA